MAGLRIMAYALAGQCAQFGWTAAGKLGEGFDFALREVGFLSKMERFE